MLYDSPYIKNVVLRKEDNKKEPRICSDIDTRCPNLEILEKPGRTIEEPILESGP